MKRIRLLVLFVLLGTAGAQAAERRYLMGTSTFADFFEFKFENPTDVDFYSIHVDDFLGIPWTEFENGTALPAAWETRVQTIATNAAASGKPIYLAVGPLKDRKTLAGQVDASGSKVENWAPVDGGGCYAFGTDPASQRHKQGYIRYLRYMIDRFHPTYLSPVIEMNIQFANCPSHKAAFKTWMNDVYATIKQDYPSLVVFPTHSLEYMYGLSNAQAWCGGTKTDASFAACFQQRLDEINTLSADRMGFSTYPLFWTLTPVAPDTYTPQIPYADAFQRVRQATNRKIWITETGWQGVPIYNSYSHTSPASACGSIFVSSPVPAGDALMANYLTQLLRWANTYALDGVVWWSNRDFLDAVASGVCPCAGSANTCNLLETVYQAGGTSGEFSLRVFGNMGLRTNDGTPRAALYNAWSTARQIPYSPAAASSPLDSVQVYPNPLRPGRGHSGVNFTQLPPDSTLKIYTLAGEKIRALSGNTIGLATWDGKNESGQPVASGVYVVLVEGAGDKKRFKVAVQR